MGCGSLGEVQVQPYGYFLHRKLKRKVNSIRKANQLSMMGQFISEDELRIIETALQPQPQSLSIADLFKFEAGQSFLLNKQRRTAWKIAVFDYSQNWGRSTLYSQNPIATDQHTKNRFYQIELDVKRTFPTIKQLDCAHLTLVLQNLTLYFQGVGYTQGMNYYVGFLLLCGFSPREVFQLFVHLSIRRQFVLIRNFTENFQNTNCCVKVVEQLINRGNSQVLKQLKAKIEGFGINLFLFIFSWFLTYFLYSFNLKSSILIWDYLLLHTANEQELHQNSSSKDTIKFGNGFVNSITITIKILQSFASKVCECSDLGQIMQILRHDSIQKYLTQQKIERLIQQCKLEPLINWQTFIDLCQHFDKQLYDMVSTKQSPISQNTAFKNFLVSCCYPKRKTQTASPTIE